MKKSLKSNNLIENRLNLKLVKCDFCNSDKYSPLLKSKDYFFNIIPGEFNIVKCLKCGLIFTNPRLQMSDIKKFYSNNLNYDNRSLNLRQNNQILLPISKEILSDYFNYSILKKSKLRKVLFLPNFLRIRKKWKVCQRIPTHIKNGRILEIGCAYGGYLILLKRLGWIVKGLELSKKAADYSKNQLNLDVEKKPIEDFHSDVLYDIVYMHMVLEHVESPKLVLKKCYSLLKPNGKLVFNIPDFSGIEVRLYKKYAYTLQLPFHLYHFTPSTIKNYLRTINFKSIRIIHEKRDTDLIVPLKYILKEIPTKLVIKSFSKIIKKRIRITLIKLIINFLAFIGRTSRMRIIAKK